MAPDLTALERPTDAELDARVARAVAHHNRQHARVDLAAELVELAAQLLATPTPHVEKEKTSGDA
ncbi:hypothetical protein E1286_04965 [Nonomuraea terrae]|uniref:Uncharacterized protein n=1 Tax=Nonomuraea terrae TaxID=2530383 RepID=A0A4R4ZB08_9ACTN|nr:hypothetical protein [Nonomuraea terrae]TDD54544.1 hypothetical protein E1286_04965 [Nonomuraea terrae]